MTRKRKIPKFKSIAEEAKFWDTHDVGDYLPEMKEVKVEVDPREPKEEVLTIRVQSALKKRLDREARNHGVNVSTLLRIWLVDKLKESKQSRLGR